MKTLEEKNKLLRSALEGFVGVSSEKDLKLFKDMFTLMPESEDRNLSLAAINALLETL